ncbi:Hypothetical protein DEACI_2998 [Acididesulfobacillus acetoxydans]|uniref:Lipoprotein n=1 Tax=Acididesulfobacillus acetoxydans TaxID=1561005 RepID=A0A8S0WQ16_9FIRM|nr:Hypothetical protein DEACI_2998 [Acididesulfobacillus acetoxydans]CEJ08441.1 Hypothetical protein DEACI_2917 [Acididesulfobacillus acetoxydans]
MSAAIIVLATAVLLLSGCSSNGVPAASADGRIIPIRLSEEEQQVLATVGVDGMDYFGFHMSLPKASLPRKESRDAHYWVDYYHNGTDKKYRCSSSTAVSLIGGYHPFDTAILLVSENIIAFQYIIKWLLVSEHKTRVELTLLNLPDHV